MAVLSYSARETLSLVNLTDCDSADARAISASGLHIKVQVQVARLSIATTETVSDIVFLGKSGIMHVADDYHSFSFAMVWNQFDLTFCMMATDVDGLHPISPAEPTFLDAFLAGMEIVYDCGNVRSNPHE